MGVFPYFRQQNTMDCGPTCLLMIAKHYGKTFKLQTLRDYCEFGKGGVSLLGICDAAERIGIKSRGVKITYKQLITEVNLPCILYWKQNHFIVVPPQRFNKKKIIIADPAKELYSIPISEFEQHWLQTIEDSEKLGIALLLEPTLQFQQRSNEKENNLSWGMVFQYLKGSKWQITQICIALLFTSIFQLIFPFLTQSIVDTGINTQDLQYITIILLAQLMLVFSRTVIDFIRGRLLLNISVKINFSLLSDFWTKLTKLPISYFDTYHTGDTLQRLGDSKKIESFLTGSALNTFFSTFNFIIFAGILMMYNTSLFFVFALGSLLYFIVNRQHKVDKI